MVGWLVELVNACLVNGWLMVGWLMVGWLVNWLVVWLLSWLVELFKGCLVDGWLNWLTDCLADLRLQSIMVKCTAAISTGIVNAYLLLQPRLNPECHPQSLDK